MFDEATAEIAVVFLDAGEDIVERETVALAVSYTHLRAHETVLDLVCRLLLEKKKTNTEMHDFSRINRSVTERLDDH